VNNQLSYFRQVAMGKRPAEEVEEEVDPVEAKRLRKAAKKAAAEAAATAEAEPEVDPAEAKKARKAAKKAAAAAEEEGPPEVDEVEAKRARKAAKKAAAAAAAAEEEAPEVDAVEAKRARKAAKKAAADAAEIPADEVVAEPIAKRLPFSRKDEAAAEEEELTVFIRGLPFSCAEETIKKDFEECGEIVSWNFPMNEEGRPRGIAFAKYATKAAVEAALKFDNSDYGGRYLEVKQAWNGQQLAEINKSNAEKGKGKGDKGKGKSDKGKDKGKDGKGKGKGKDKNNSAMNSDFAVFVGGLPFSVDEEKVKAHFAACGEIASVRMPTWEDGSSKGIAFVRFTCDEHVEASIKLNETELEGRYMIVRRASDTKKGDKGKDGKGKDDKGKGGGKEGKSKGKDDKGKKGQGRSEDSLARFGAKVGNIVESTGTAKTFDESDEE